MLLRSSTFYVEISTNSTRADGFFLSLPNFFWRRRGEPWVGSNHHTANKTKRQGKASDDPEKSSRLTLGNAYLATFERRKRYLLWLSST